jgi:hypothetical protein
MVMGFYHVPSFFREPVYSHLIGIANPDLTQVVFLSGFIESLDPVNIQHHEPLWFCEYPPDGHGSKRQDPGHNLCGYQCSVDLQS